MSFTKTDLKTGDIVRLRNQKEYIVVRNTPMKDMIINQEDKHFIRLEDFNEQMEYGNIKNMSPLDIVIVYRSNVERQLMDFLETNHERADDVVFCGGKMVLSKKSACHVRTLIEKGYTYTDGVRSKKDGREHLEEVIPELSDLGIWFDLEGLLVGQQEENGHENLPQE